MSEGNGQVSNPFSRAVPLALSMHLLGVSRQAKTGREVEVDDDDFTTGYVEAGDDLTTVNKKILECKEYSCIQSQAGVIRRYLRDNQVKGAGLLFSSSVYPIPLRKTKEVQAEMTRLETAFRGLVGDFIKVYPARVEEAKVRLKTQKVFGRTYDLSNDKDYPPVEKVEKEFWIFHRWVDISPAQSLSAVDLDMYQDNIKKDEALRTTARQEMEAALFTFVGGVVSHLADRLRPGKDGVRKSLGPEAFKAMKQMLKDLPDINTTDSAKIREVGERCQAILNGYGLEVLKDSESTRKLAAAKLDQVRREIDKAVIDAPKRLVRDLPD